MYEKSVVTGYGEVLMIGKIISRGVAETGFGVVLPQSSFVFGVVLPLSSCFYDDYTVIKYRNEFGEDIPRFPSSEIDVERYGTTLLWLQEQLGDFTDYVRSVVKEYQGGKFLILFFPPSVLDSSRVPAAIRMVNIPLAHWKYPNLDRIQVEDYDWLIHENDGHPSVFNFAQTYFEYPSGQVDYFSGFAWDQYKIENDYLIVKNRKRKM